MHHIIGFFFFEDATCRSEQSMHMGDVRTMDPIQEPEKKVRIDN